MISRLATLLLLTLGLLSLVTARPVSDEDAVKQDTSINPLLSDKDLEELFKSLFPSSNNVKKQGFGASITLPDGRTFDWGKEQGLRAPFTKGETQGASQNAKKQGLSFTLPDGNTFEFGEEQGRRIALPKEQSYMGNSLEDYLNGLGLFQPSKTAKEQGISITLPGGNTFGWGEEQGWKGGWGHEQGRRVPFAEEQGWTGGWSHEQGRRVPFAEEQGWKGGWSHEQGRRVPFAEEQGWRGGWPSEKQGRRLMGEKQSWTVPYYGSDIWSKEQDAKPVSSVKKQSSINPWLNYRYPYSGFSKEQGIKLRVPSARQQSSSLYYPGFYNPLYGKQQGIRKIIPTSKQQDIQFPFPLYYYNTPISGKDEKVQAAFKSNYNTAALQALCKAASDKDKIAEVATYVQQNFDDLFKQFQGFTNFCDLINGSGGDVKTEKVAKGLSKELNELFDDKK